jgi:hypothetical protein
MSSLRPPSSAPSAVPVAREPSSSAKAATSAGSATSIASKSRPGSSSTQTAFFAFRVANPSSRSFPASYAVATAPSPSGKRSINTTTMASVPERSPAFVSSAKPPSRVSTTSSPAGRPPNAYHWIARATSVSTSTPCTRANASAPPSAI